MRMIKKYFKEIYDNRYVLVNLVKLDLQLRYNKSALGVAWSLITPMGLSIMIGLVYSVIFGVSVKSFIPMLFAGINPWNFINSAVDGGTMAYINAEGYIKQTTVSPSIFPLRVVMGGFINLLYSIVAFFIVYLFLAPEKFSPIMLLVIPGLIITCLASAGLANITAFINLHMRDFRPLQSLVLQGLFYVTPIIYSTEMMDETGYSLVYKLNPLYYWIEIIRSPLMGEMPTVNVFLIAVIISVFIFVIGVVLSSKANKGLAMKL